MNQVGPTAGQDVDDLDLLAERSWRVTRFTVVLMVAVLAGLAFIGGVVAQKQFGATATAGMRGGSGMPGGYAMPGGGGFGGGRSSELETSAGADAASGEGAVAASGTPAVVGTVTRVSGRTVTVRNFADESVTVKVPKGTAISDSSDSALGGLAKGVSVSVVGEKAEDGTVTATRITAS